MADKQNGRLNLYGLSPEEIARRLLETPPPPERDDAKVRARLKRKLRSEKESELNAEVEAQETRR